MGFLTIFYKYIIKSHKRLFISVQLGNGEGVLGDVNEEGKLAISFLSKQAVMAVMSFICKIFQEVISVSLLYIFRKTILICEILQESPHLEPHLSSLTYDVQIHELICVCLLNISRKPPPGASCFLLHLIG